MRGAPIYAGLSAAIVLSVSMSVPAPAAGAASCRHADAVPTVATVAPARRATLCLINVVRTQRGLPIVHTTPELRSVAKRYAANMMHHNFFSHVTPGGRRVTDRARRSGYVTSATREILGENLGWGLNRRATPRALVSKWLRSPRHARVMLNPVYRDTGIGVVFGAPVEIAADDTAATYAVTFGVRYPRSAPPG